MIQTPAEKLEGTTLPCGWRVIKYIPKQKGQSGGNFSVGYEVEKEGTTAFLKALDLKKLMSARGFSDHLKAINIMTNSFEYERDILKDCRDAGLSRVIRSLSDGTIEGNDVSVPYIIFEMAAGDIRKQSISQAGFDLAWALKSMHQICVGIKQLHSNGITHQDLKPSNILLVKSKGNKIGDFGTCVTRDCNLEHVTYNIAGDRTYAPPEGLYGYTEPDWATRRYGNDAYQAGSLLVFMIVGLPMTTLLVNNLSNDYRPDKWGRNYEDILPYLAEAFVRVIDIIETLIPEEFRKDLIPIIKELCEPSIHKRGDPIQYRRNLNPFSMERYISRLNTLLKNVEYKLM